MPSMRFWPLSGRGRSTPASRPTNVASLRVLETCGFRVIATERNVAEASSTEIEELVLRLDELASPE